MFSNCFAFVSKIALLVLCVGLVNGKELPSYITKCKKDPDTIAACAVKVIEVLRPKLAVGIPEVNVPAIEPFFIHEFVVDSGDLRSFRAIGRDVKVFGASNFKLKYLGVDLDKLEYKIRVTIPKIYIEGRYTLNAKVFNLADLRGRGEISATATKVLGDALLKAELVKKQGVEYMNFTRLDVSIDIGDFNVKLSDLSNGNAVITDIANQVINTNKAEALRTAKPLIEKNLSNLFLSIANNVVDGVPYDHLFA